MLFALMWIGAVTGDRPRPVFSWAVHVVAWPLKFVAAFPKLYMMLQYVKTHSGVTASWNNVQWPTGFTLSDGERVKWGFVARTISLPGDFTDAVLAQVVYPLESALDRLETAVTGIAPVARVAIAGAADGGTIEVSA